MAYVDIASQLTVGISRSIYDKHNPGWRIGETKFLA
jgi:hypothetical protein